MTKTLTGAILSFLGVTLGVTKEVEQKNNESREIFQDTDNCSKEFFKIKESFYDLQKFVHYFVKGRSGLPFELNSLQESLASEVDSPWFKSLNRISERRSGKTTFLAIFALHEMIFHKNQCVAYVSPTLNISKAGFFAEFKNLLKELSPELMKTLRLTIEDQTSNSIRLSNGSVLFIMPASCCSFRGMEISTLLVDEYNEIKNYQELKKVYTPGVRSLVELSS
jgi:hypothetical protein